MLLRYDTQAPQIINSVKHRLYQATSITERNHSVTILCTHCPTTQVGEEPNARLGWIVTIPTGPVQQVGAAHQTTATSPQQQRLLQEMSKGYPSWFSGPASLLPSPSWELVRSHEVSLHKPRVTVELAGAGFYCKKHQNSPFPVRNLCNLSLRQK